MKRRVKKKAQQLSPCLSESTFKSQILRIAHQLGWTVYSIPDSRRATSVGFPDLVLAHHLRHKILYRELKTNKHKTTAEQEQWLATLKATGHDADVWRETDLDRIIRELTDLI